MDLRWLDRPYRRSELSRFAQEGVGLARVLRATGWTVRELVVAIGPAWRPVLSERKVRRRLKRARLELTRERRTCVCGCAEPVPATTSRRLYASPTHKKRVQRRRKREDSSRFNRSPMSPDEEPPDTLVFGQAKPPSRAIDRWVGRAYTPPGTGTMPAEGGSL